MRSLMSWVVIAVAVLGVLPVSAQEETPEPPAETEVNSVGTDAATGSEPAMEAETESELYNFLYFLGRFHPIVLHFPIGLLVILLLLELLTFFRPVQAEPAKALLLIVGALSAVVAATLGWFLEWSASFDDELVFWHRWWSVGVAASAVLACVARALMIRQRSRGYAFLYGLLLFGAVGALAPAGHYGAALTHGPNYLVTYLPEQLEVLRPILGEPVMETAADSGEGYFAAEIFPILEAKCLECHSGGKQDGDLSLESREFALAGGESGKPAIVPGHAAASYMIELMFLPPEHPDVMPPVGEPQLTAAETIKLAQWVNQDAPWGDVEITVVARAEPETTAVAVSGDAAAVDIVDAKELMELLFEPPFEALQRGLAQEPEGRSAIREVYQSAFTLAEAHNLLFSRTGEDYIDTPEWGQLTIEGRDASEKLGMAIQAREYPPMKEAFATLVESCNRCHTHFELDVDPMELEPEPERTRGSRD